MKTKKGEKEKLRRTILEKAIAYFKKHGHGGTGTDEVMRFMGLTRGALYSHFKSKDDLFANAVSYDLEKLVSNLSEYFDHDGKQALKNIIEAHLSEQSLTNVEGGCAFTSLSSDMQRCKPSQRGRYEIHMDRIYELFGKAFQKQFPNESDAQIRARSFNLYSGLVGTLTMARTMKDKNKALEILRSGREFLLDQFTQ